MGWGAGPKIALEGGPLGLVETSRWVPVSLRHRRAQ